MGLGHYCWRFNRDRKRGLLAIWHHYVTLQKALTFRLPDPEDDVPVELHIVTGREYWLLGLWMLSSFFLMTRRSWPVTFHDDGSCDTAVQEGIKKVAPFARFIPRSEADKEVSSRLQNYPKTLSLRQFLPLTLKLLDTGLLCDSPKRLVLDCDMLFFQEPSEILQWETGQKPSSLFLADVADASAIHPSQFEEFLGITPLHNLNSGLCALSQGFLDLPMIEAALARTSLLSAKRWWTIEQTLFAVLAGTRDAKLLPRSYVVSIEKKAPETTIMRHYIGKVRDRFYAEGLARISAALIRNFGRGVVYQTPMRLLEA
jgi:hypothetical protein